jgi:hypothetical protein
VIPSPHIRHKIEAPSLSLEELDVSAQHLQPAATITTTSMEKHKTKSSTTTGNRRNLPQPAATMDSE